MNKYPKVNYIGNKEKLVDWIIKELPIKKGTVLDLFSGGASVSYALKKSGFSVISNDILYSNYVLAKALVENEKDLVLPEFLDLKIDKNKQLEKRVQLSFLEDNLYYDYEIDELSKLLCISDQLDGYQKYLFLSLIRRAMVRKLPYSRMNVPWDQIQILRDEEYSYNKYGRRRAYHNQSFKDHIIENLPSYNDAIFSKQKCHCYNYDAFKMIESIDYVDAVYMDPPYPSTMNNYDAFYGLFDKMFGIENEHSDFTNQSTFLSNLEELIKSLTKKTKYIIISQNSRVKPTPKELEDMLSTYGNLTVKRKKHNYKVTGKEKKNENYEMLFILELC